MLCADCVSCGGILLDIGTDHAYLPCYLAARGIISHAYACDISDGPIGAAKKTVAGEGLENAVTVIKSDGFQNISDEALSMTTDVTIAGMGSELIVKILSEHSRLPENIRLILQPNTRAHILRQFLFENGFKILSERAVAEGKFIYTVILAVRGENAFPPDGIYLYAGKLDPSEKYSREYISRIINRLSEAADKMNLSQNPDDWSHARDKLSLANKLQKYIDDIKQRSN